MTVSVNNYIINISLAQAVSVIVAADLFLGSHCSPLIDVFVHISSLELVLTFWRL
jgi:hypothetical protein